MEPYPSGQFGFIDDPDRQFGNSSVSTRTRTRSDSPEPLLTLDTIRAQILNLRQSCDGEMKCFGGKTGPFPVGRVSVW